MIEGYSHNKDESMCIRVWLEVGHACSARSRSARGTSLALDWRVWVRGPPGTDISAFVHKVVFYLNPPAAFVYPKRVIHEPPYEIQESGSSSIDIPIHVYLKHTTQPKIKLRYSLAIDNLFKSCTESSSLFYDFVNPSETLEKLLMMGGGEIVPTKENDRRADARPIDNVPMRNDSHKPFKKRQRIEDNKQSLRKTSAPYSIEQRMKLSEPPNVELAKLLKTVNMTQSEIDLVSHLYISYSSYEKSVSALKLPCLTDPIYRVPELPASLRASLTSVESHYSTQ